MKPSFALLAVTHRCNSRCIMCDVWKNEDSGKNEMKPVEYEGIPSSLRHIGITGGEPFMRDDLVEIIRVLKHKLPRLKLTLNTNGFMPEKLEKTVPEILKYAPDIAIRVSIDGVKETHEKIRGVKGGFDKALDSIYILKNSGVRNIGIVFTIMRRNIEELLEIHCLASKFKVHFTTSLVVQSPIYFGPDKRKLSQGITKDNFLSVFNKLIRRRFRSIQPIDWIKGWFERHLLRHYFTGKRALPCQAGKDFLYIDPIGNVYPCSIIPYKLGNLKDKDNLWSQVEDSKLKELLLFISNCHDCWLVCSVRNSAERHRFKVISEILSNKFKTMFI